MAPIKTRVAQNVKGVSGLILAKLLPSGGAIKKPIRWRVNINPITILLGAKCSISENQGGKIILTNFTVYGLI